MSTDSEPEAFGHYQLLEKIATGGMAEVWRARAHGISGFEKILVIKKVLAELGKDQEFRNLFVDEARIAAELLHVNIVQVFELDAVYDQLFMAMEYVHGLDLSRLITRARNLGPFPIPLALFIVAEVLKALQFLERDIRLADQMRIDLSLDLAAEIEHACATFNTEYGFTAT